MFSFDYVFIKWIKIKHSEYIMAQQIYYTIVDIIIG